MEALLAAAKKLRAAQIAYLNNRGDESLGRAVGMAAQELDIVIAKIETRKEIEKENSVSTWIAVGGIMLVLAALFYSALK